MAVIRRAGNDDSIHILSCHDQDPSWHWLADLYSGTPAVQWRSISSHRSALTRSLPGPHLGRIRAGVNVATSLARGWPDLLVSHGPRLSYYVEAVGRRRNHGVPHLAFAFNFTDIPTGRRLRLMRRVFARIDSLTVYSRMERELYAEIFDVPVERFRFVRWGVAPPIALPDPPATSQPYVAAVGGEARDYRTLCEAARRLPHVRFVLIVRPFSLEGLEVPANVTVHVNLPWQQTWSAVWHSAATVVPLRSSRTPNGLVTVVGGMHLGKAQVVTDSEAIRDYIEDETNGLLVPAGSAAEFAAAIERLLDDAPLRHRLGTAARVFAAEHCSEAVTIEWFRNFLIEHFPAQQ